LSSKPGLYPSYEQIDPSALPAVAAAPAVTLP
jgi:hypothetical protein